MTGGPWSKIFAGFDDSNGNPSVIEWHRYCKQCVVRVAMMMMMITMMIVMMMTMIINVMMMITMTTVMTAMGNPSVIEWHIYCNC